MADNVLSTFSCLFTICSSIGTTVTAAFGGTGSGVGDSGAWSAAAGGAAGVLSVDIGVGFDLSAAAVAAALGDEGSRACDRGGGCGSVCAGGDGSSMWKGLVANGAVGVRAIPWWCCVAGQVSSLGDDRLDRPGWVLLENAVQV